MKVDKSGESVRRMFGEIAHRYDLLNHLLSLGIDRRWRRRTVRLVPPGEEGPILDVCTGTGDLALCYWRACGGRVPVVGADFCRQMLSIGHAKARHAEARVALVEVDAQELPFPDDSFQIVSVAFGLRNVSDTGRGLGEMVRVCRPGGHVAVLEFSLPESWPLRPLYGWYFHHVLPRVGQALARNRRAAYNYLPASVEEFSGPEALADRMRGAGLTEVRVHRFTFGVAALCVGMK